jgi:DNA mismatch repair protein MutS2
VVRIHDRPPRTAGRVAPVFAAPNAAYTQRVDRDTLDVLEFPAIVERLAGATETPRGASLAHELVPSGDRAEVERRQALTAEAIALVESSAEPELAGIADVRDHAERAGRGGVLAPAELRAVATSVAVALQARRVLEAARETAPLLWDVVAPVDPALTTLADAVVRAVDDDGSDLRDSASPVLRRLRRELREGRQRAADELARLARSRDVADHLQEQFVTTRGGRPVLAVKVSARGKVPGIVHDSSASGQTLFVEPFAVAELNNRLAEAAGAERDEVERILRELSALVGERAAALHVLVEATAALDLALASATLSRRWRGAEVEIGEDVRLLAARHPLLDERSAVPIDLDLGDLRALVISGPNTGGKTVALKTLGLAALLHQAGLRPPAAEAALPIFDKVLADVGDRQSIEMSLSTFSGHLETIIGVLGAATDRSLVLLDEVAGGTDPVEGSALAQALVARLARQARLTVVTTHYAELTEWASATAGVANAATAFDAETHRPLYRVLLGRPGTSHALDTAERLGVDGAVVEDARARIAPERRRISELLAEAEAAARAATDARDRTERERVAATRLTDQADRRGRELEEEIARVHASAERERELAIAEAERDLAEARAELSALRDEVRTARRQERERLRVTSAASMDAERSRDRSLGAAAEQAARAEHALRELRPVTAQAPLAPGDPVEAPDYGVRGTIAAIDGGEAEVVGPGGLRVRIALGRLQPDARREPADERAPAVRVVAGATATASDQLDVRGLRAQEAREAVRSFVDDASLAGLPTVRVVHGRGTGAVRAAVREELAQHTLVERHEPDEHDGATLAHLG